MTVLVVEDECLIRLDLVSYLETAGFHVLEASSAAEAISILENDRSVRAVFTDIRMPGDMDGLALARCVRERWPPTIIIICSANSFDRDVLGDIHILDKPYAQERVTKLLGILSDELRTRET